LGTVEEKERQHNGTKKLIYRFFFEGARGPEWADLVQTMGLGSSHATAWARTNRGCRHRRGPVRRTIRQTAAPVARRLWKERGSLENLPPRMKLFGGRAPLAALLSAGRIPQPVARRRNLHWAQHSAIVERRLDTACCHSPVTADEHPIRDLHIQGRSITNGSVAETCRERASS